MKKYKLIKKYPGSKEIGTMVKAIHSEAGLNTRYTDMIGGEYGWREIEDYPEYWEEIKEPTFKVGDWLYCLDDGWNDTGHRKYSKPTRKGDVFRIKEFDKCTFEDWNVAVSDDGRVTYTHKYPNKFRLATTQEIETHLIAEAEKKGFVGQKTINSLSIASAKWTMDARGGYRYCSDLDMFEARDVYGNLDCTIYQKGKWATIAEVKEEEIKIGGYNTSFDYGQGMFYVGCRRFTFASIKSLYQNMCHFGVSMVRVSNIDIEARTVKLILDRAEKQ